MPEDRIGEIRDEVRALRIEFHDGLRRIEDTRVHRDVFSGLVDRVEDLEESNRWLYRLVIGAVLLAALDLVMSSPLVG